MYASIILRIMKKIYSLTNYTDYTFQQSYVNDKKVLQQEYLYVK